MPEENQTLNDTEVAAPSPATNTDGLIATVDESIPAAPSEETIKTDTETKVETEAAKAAEDVKIKEEIERFDKHPRFQELITGNKGLKEQLKSLQEQLDANKQVQTKPLDYKDISAMKPEELRDWMDEDPVEYTANLARQIRHEVAAELEAKRNTQTYEEKVLGTFREYASKDPSFDKMWESGEIQSFMDKNPGHNAISAHMAMTSETKLNEVMEKVRKETEEQIIKKFKAKQGAKVLGSGPTSTGSVQGKIAPELLDPKKFGGNMSVLAARSAERRRAAG